MSFSSFFSPVLGALARFAPFELGSMVKIANLKFDKSADGVSVSFSIVNNSSNLVTIANAESAIEANWHDNRLVAFVIGDYDNNNNYDSCTVSLNDLFPIYIKPKEKEDFSLKADNKAVMSAKFSISRRSISKGEPEYYLNIK